MLLEIFPIAILRSSNPVINSYNECVDIVTDIVENFLNGLMKYIDSQIGL